MKIDIKMIILFFLIIFLLKPVGIETINPTINTIMNVFKLISIGYIMLIYIANIMTRKIKVNIYIKLMAIIELISIITCIINNMSFYNAFVFWHSILCFMLLFELYKSYYKNFMKTLELVLIIYIISNFIYSVINFNNITIQTNYILGKKNMLILYIFPYLYILLMNNVINSKNKINIKNIIMITICFISIYFSTSSTSIVACWILVIYYLFSKFWIFRKIVSLIKARTILIFMIIFFFLIVVFQVQNNFQYLIIDVLGKDLTFTGRTIIWNRTIEMIKENIWGYGWDSLITNVPSMLVYISEFTEIGHAHNLILNIAFKSGIIAAIIYLIYMYLIAKKIDKMDESEEKSITKIGFAIYWILFTFESYPTNCVCLFFIVYLMSQSDVLFKEERGKR